MNVGLIAAILVVAGIQSYFLISEIVLSGRTARGKDNLADRGTLRLLWILFAVAFISAWVPVMFHAGRLLAFGDWLTWAGIPVMTAGLVFRRYVINFLGASFTSTVQIREDQKLIKAGPYRYIRHPSYSGMLLLAFGYGISISNWISFLICVVLPAIGIIRRINIEEKEMHRHFGEEFRDYRERTWRIIPYVY